MLFAEDWKSHKLACKVMSSDDRGPTAGLDLTARQYAERGEALEAGGTLPTGHANYREAATQYRLCVEKAQLDLSSAGIGTQHNAAEYTAAGTGYLALALRRMGRYEEAGRNYKRAVKLWKAYVNTVQTFCPPPPNLELLVAHGNDMRRSNAANFVTMTFSAMQTSNMAPAHDQRNVTGGTRLYKQGDKGTAFGGADQTSMQQEIFRGFSPSDAGSKLEHYDIHFVGPFNDFVGGFDLLRVDNDGCPSIVRFSHSSAPNVREILAPTSQREAGPGRYFFKKGNWCCTCAELGKHMLCVPSPPNSKKGKSRQAKAVSRKAKG